MLSFFRKSKSLFLSSVLLGLVSCGEPPYQAEGPRHFIKDLEDSDNQPDEVVQVPTGNNSAANVDYLNTSMSACYWQSQLAQAYKDPSYTGRFRMLGSIYLSQNKPEKPNVKHLEVFKVILSIFDLVLPRNKFSLPEQKPMAAYPAGRVDLRSNSLNSFALLNEASKQIPSREKFLAIVDETIKAQPLGFIKLRLFKMALRTGQIDALEKRDEIVQEEIEKVFPGLFSPAGAGDFSESFPWVLVSNAVGNTSRLNSASMPALKVFEEKLAVFRPGGWPSFADDMSKGMAAAIKAYQSSNAKERACAANILFRSSEQLLQLMGQETLPHLNSKAPQSYVPSLRSVLNTRTGSTLQRCQSAGSLIKNGKRMLLKEKDMHNLSKDQAQYRFAETPMPIRFCEPSRSMTAPVSAVPSVKISAFQNQLSRVDAFANYLFLLNPAASWWKSKAHPMGVFQTMEQIQKSKKLVPIELHAAVLAFLQLDLLHLEKKHLVLLTEQGQRTLDATQAWAVRLSEKELPPTTQVTQVESSLSSTLKFLDLMFKFERYIQLLESWSKTASTNTIKSFFVERSNLQTLIGRGEDSAYSMIQDLYVGMSMYLIEFIDISRSNVCYDRLQYDLRSGVETKSGECSSQRKNFSAALMKLGQRLESQVLMDKAQNLLR